MTRAIFLGVILFSPDLYTSQQIGGSGCTEANNGIWYQLFKKLFQAAGLNVPQRAAYPSGCVRAARAFRKDPGWRSPGSSFLLAQDRQA